MTDIIVTTLNDELDAGASLEAPEGGGLSLREALSLAQDGDRVFFANELNGTIRLDAGLGRLVIDDIIGIYGGNRIVITGDSAENDTTLANGVTDLTQTADANLSDNIQLFYLNVPDPSLGDVRFDGLTLTGGRSTSYGGGAMDAFNTNVVISNSLLAGNTAADGTGGGAVYSAGTLTVENSTFSGNDAVTGNGGAIDSRGTATITNSTFTGNTAEGSQGGGAIYSTGELNLN